MGLDNGFYVRSNKREITREMLPPALRYPFEKDYNGDVEICYGRKWWGLRSQLLKEINWSEIEKDYYFFIDTPSEITHVIEVVASWLNEERWEDEGNSIWSYEEAQPNLINWIINLALIMAWMENNPDAYLVFYDSY